MELGQTSEFVQQAGGLGGLALLGTALTLGLRHGIDWDHLAAISDITSTTGANDARSRVNGVPGGASTSASIAVSPRALGGGLTGVPGGALGGGLGGALGKGIGGVVGSAFGGVNWRAVWLAALYAIGHGLVVVALGLAALTFGAILPEWVDPIMERVVGATLLFLGAWVAFSLVRFWRGDADFRLQSRWMLVFSGVRRAWGGVQRRLHGHSHEAGRLHVHRVDQYGPGTAFGTGLIHGIGAETGTQVLIIAAVGGAASQGLGAGMLLAFVAGLLVSNTAVALLTSAGFLSATRVKSLYVVAGVLAALFSLWIGSYAVLGISDQLPDIQLPITALFGEAEA